MHHKSLKINLVQHWLNDDKIEFILVMQVIKHIQDNGCNVSCQPKNYKGHDHEHNK